MDIHDALEDHATDAAGIHGREVVSEHGTVRETPVLNPRHLLLLLLPALPQAPRASAAGAASRDRRVSLAQLVDLVDDLDHVARDARRGHVRVDLVPPFAQAAERADEGLLAADDVDAAVDGAHGAQLQGRDGARELVAVAVGAGLRQRDAARVEGQDLVVPGVAVRDALQQRAGAEHEVDAGPARATGIHDDGAAERRVALGHGGRAGDDGEAHAGRVVGRVEPVQGHRQLGALEGVVAGGVIERRGRLDGSPVEGLGGGMAAECGQEEAGFYHGSHCGEVIRSKYLTHGLTPTTDCRTKS